MLCPFYRWEERGAEKLSCGPVLALGIFRPHIDTWCSSRTVRRRKFGDMKPFDTTSIGVKKFCCKKMLGPNLFPKSGMAAFTGKLS